MRKFFLIILNILLFTSVSGQTKIQKYEYWFDGNFSKKTSTAILPVEDFTLNSTIPANTLENGVHTFNIRFQDNTGKWTSIMSSYFYKMIDANLPVNREINLYEYWFDSNYESRILTPVSPSKQATISTLIPANSLVDGLHNFNFRTKDNSGMWSSTLSMFFYKMTGVNASINRKIVEFEYWFDNNFAGKVKIAISPSENVVLDELVSASELKDGVHTLNIRIKDDSGLWSSPLSQFFYSMPSQSVVSNKIEGFRYWIDNDFLKVNYVQANPAAKNFYLMENLDLSKVPTGKHGIHFQFRDALGFWSSVTTDSIERVAPPVSIEKRLESGAGLTVQVYPNPTAGMLRVDLGSIRNTARIELMDSRGRVLSETVSNNSRYMELSVSYPAGIYILRIISGNLQEIVRIVKQ